MASNFFKNQFEPQGFGRDLWNQELGLELGFVGCGFGDATEQGVQHVANFFRP
jgi:hypothetical protein